MLKTVSSVANALGALNYQGTWNATTNTPTLASGVGTQGDYYVVSVAGATDLDGITNWGVGDWAAFNGSVWQRVEGGADGNFVNLDVTNAATFNTVYASTSVAVGNPANYQATFYMPGANANYVQVANGVTGAGPLNGILYGLDASGNGVLNKHGAGDLITTVAGIERLRILQAGTLDVSAANIAFDSGYGIDFSATAGTGTSELFSDYEEGDWTPTLQATDGAFNSVTYDTLTGGKYTKIGNVVHIQCYMRTDALDNTVGRSGDVVIEGLPFASVTASTGINGHSAFSVGITSAFAGENPSMSFVGGGGQTGMQLMYQTAADGNTSNLKPSDLGTGVNSNIVLISGTYTSA
jgi:hypothetical protein